MPRAGVAEVVEVVEVEVEAKETRLEDDADDVVVDSIVDAFLRCWGDICATLVWFSLKEAVRGCPYRDLTIFERGRAERGERAARMVLFFLYYFRDYSNFFFCSSGRLLNQERERKTRRLSVRIVHFFPHSLMLAASRKKEENARNKPH